MKLNVLVDTSAWMRAHELEQHDPGHREMNKIIKEASADPSLCLLYSEDVIRELQGIINDDERDAKKRQQARETLSLVELVGNIVHYTGSGFGKATFGLMTFGKTGWEGNQPSHDKDKLILDVVPSGTETIDFVISSNVNHFSKRKNEIENHARQTGTPVCVMTPEEFLDWYRHRDQEDTI